MPDLLRTPESKIYMELQYWRISKSEHRVAAPGATRLHMLELNPRLSHRLQNNGPQ